MQMGKLSFLVLVFCSMTATGQEIFSDRIIGLRVYGSVKAGFPLVIQDSTALTVEFDTNEDKPANFRLKYYHCNRDWNRTLSDFVNDESRNTSHYPLSYRTAPAGVQKYRYHYVFRLPGVPEIQRFLYSGNHILELWDEDGTERVAACRFLVAEKTVKPALKVVNTRLAEQSPYDLAHKIEVQDQIPEMVKRRQPLDTFGKDGPDSPEQQEVLNPLQVSSMDVYKNRELYRPSRFDLNSPGAHTMMNGFGTSRITLTIENISPGNVYRRLDIRNVAAYPPGQPLLSRKGADVPRLLYAGNRDNHGLSSVTDGDQYADYLNIQFEFRDDDKSAGDSIYVVGDFNGWQPSVTSLMKYNPDLKRFVLTMSVRRGTYDYQYVYGSDWVEAEGSDWRTINIYTAVLYYHDNRLGGYDRILGVVQGQSSGKNESEN